MLKWIGTIIQKVLINVLTMLVVGLALYFFFLKPFLGL